MKAMEFRGLKYSCSQSLCIALAAHVDNEMCLVRALERLGSAALSKEEPDIGAAFLKFSVVTKELSALMKTLVSLFAYIYTYIAAD